MQREDFIDKSTFALISSLRMKQEQIHQMEVSAIGERYGALRVVNPRADEAMLRSLKKYGQISPVVCALIGSGYELVDGFKRLRACRRLNQTVVKTKTVDLNARACKAAIIQLNRSGKSITAMEEAMVLQSLYREEGLTQVEIAVLLGRHKSWVSRRISLMERLSEQVHEDISLGLISASVGLELAKLPRGNQQETLSAVRKHRLNKRETEKLISHLQRRPRWERQVILDRPWEIIQQEQPKPTGLQAKLISMQGICMTVSEGVRKSSPEIRAELWEYTERAIHAALLAVGALRAER